MINLIKRTGKLVAAVQILAIGLTLLTACTFNAPLTVCHATGDAANPYQLITVNSDQLKDHREHPNDIIPAPVGGCPAVAGTTEGKVTICHATGSETNPYTLITVSVNGLDGHNQHTGDIIPAPAEGCPKTKP